jgi:ribose 5-phosphate isomerase RpiB
MIDCVYLIVQSFFVLKGEVIHMIRTIAFVQDSESIEVGLIVAKHLQEAGLSFTCVGTIPTQVNACEADIVIALKEIVGDADIALGVSISGNGIAIYGNKLENYIAAPITSFPDVEEAVSCYSCNMFDVPASNESISELFQYAIKLIGEK